MQLTTLLFTTAAILITTSSALPSDSWIVAPNAQSCKAKQDWLDPNVAYTVRIGKPCNFVNSANECQRCDVAKTALMNALCKNTNNGVVDDCLLFSCSNDVGNNVKLGFTAPAKGLRDAINKALKGDYGNVGGFNCLSH
jgi:hypothetical protein